MQHGDGARFVPIALGQRRMHPMAIGGAVAGLLIDGCSPLSTPLPPSAALESRLLINQRSKTNLCLDFGFGRQGSRGVYLAIQEAF